MGSVANDPTSSLWDCKPGTEKHHASIAQLEKSEEGIITPPFSCATSVLIQVLQDKDRLLLGLCRVPEQNELTL